MADFSLLDILPNGVIIFKDNKIDYINRHLLDVLSIGYLSRKNAIEQVLIILDIKSEEDLFLFFSSNDYFNIGKKLIQIEHGRHDDYDIFSFIKINPSQATKRLEVNPADKKIYIDEKVAKHFKINNIQKVNVLMFYKGVPLNNAGKIIRINNDSIEVLVNSKHSVALLENDEVLLIMNSKKGASVLHGNVVKTNNNIFTIKNFYLTKEEKHLRNGLRVKPDKEMIVNANERDFKVYDISENAISLYIDSVEEEEYLKKVKSIKISINNSTLILNVKYLKTIFQDDKVLKIIFKTSTTASNAVLLNKFIVDKHNEILREIHNFKNNSIS